MAATNGDEGPTVQAIKFRFLRILSPTPAPRARERAVWSRRRDSRAGSKPRVSPGFRRLRRSSAQSVTTAVMLYCDVCECVWSSQHALSTLYLGFPVRRGSVAAACETPSLLAAMSCLTRRHARASRWRVGHSATPFRLPFARKRRRCAASRLSAVVCCVACTS